VRVRSGKREGSMNVSNATARLQSKGTSSHATNCENSEGKRNCLAVFAPRSGGLCPLAPPLPLALRGPHHRSRTKGDHERRLWKEEWSTHFDEKIAADRRRVEP
jgi:hypothetical protein